MQFNSFAKFFKLCYFQFNIMKLKFVIIYYLLQPKNNIGIAKRLPTGDENKLY